VGGKRIKLSMQVLIPVTTILVMTGVELNSDRMEPQKTNLARFKNGKKQNYLEAKFTALSVKV
jgi:hypothetical protein